MPVTINGTTGINTPGVVNTAAETIATTLAVTGVTTVQAGTAALPAITTTGDTNTGIFFPAADTIAFAEGGVEAMRINSSGNVGIGTNSPATKLDVNGALQLRANGVEGGQVQLLNPDNGSNGLVVDVSSTNNARIFSTANNFALQIGQLVGTGGNVAFFTEAAERARIDSSGNVGIGTTSPTTPLDVKVGTGNFTVGLSGAGNTQLTATGALRLDATGGTTLFLTGGAERMRIDSSGRLLVGTTTLFTNAGSKQSILYDPANEQGITIKANATTFNGNAILFRNNADGTSGFIAQSQTTVGYNTSSDYRLKNTITSMTGALAKVALLKPVTYKWNVDETNGQGFIAHELAEVVPDCVTGEKDAVNEDGSVKPQGIDTSFLVATLTAAIQELKTIVDAQAARITALEAI